jgi:beta-1,2-mannobiose phosphorylase / 1,2-beta-oligomannan phosphorylase
MVDVQKEGIIIGKTKHAFENSGVLNPATFREGEIVHLLYRAVKTGNRSTIGYCRLKGPLALEERNEVPLLSPELPCESHGIEDPRLVKIDDLYYLTYCAFDGVNAMGALATSHDLVHFERRGLIVPQFSYEEMKALIHTKVDLNEKYKRYNSHHDSWTNSGEKKLVWDKNVVFFPRRINGKLYFLHRIKPDIQITSVFSLDELTEEFWTRYIEDLQDHIVLCPKYEHEVSYIGAGCPPIETEHGWILIYHSVHDTMKGYVYSASAALMDLEDPSKELARLPYPLFTPEHDWELTGEVNNVVFPTGTAVFDDTLYIYYGAADEQIGCASLNLRSLTEELLLYKLKNRDHEFSKQTKSE